MDRCLLTVKREGRSAWKDLEVPVDMPASDLVSALVKALRWEDVSQNVSYTGVRIRVDPPGRLLGPEETLEDANVKDGSVLTLVTSGAEPAAPPPPARAAQPQPQPQARPTQTPAPRGPGRPAAGPPPSAGPAPGAPPPRPSAPTSPVRPAGPTPGARPTPGAPPRPSGPAPGGPGKNVPSRWQVLDDD